MKDERRARAAGAAHHAAAVIGAFSAVFVAASFGSPGGALRFGLAGGLVAAVAAAERVSLPDDPRLAPVRADLEKALERAAKSGAPAEMIVSKVREGLAKGVSPEAIRGAAERLADSLVGAAQLLRAHRAPSSPPAAPALVRVVAEARLAGVANGDIVPLVAGRETDEVTARAVEVVTDLAVRGYPGRPSALVVKEVAERDAPSLGRVVAGLEAIRSEQTVSRADALQVVSRNLSASGASFDAAVARALETGDRAGGASASSPGKSGDAPGHQGGAGVGKIKKPKK